MLKRTLSALALTLAATAAMAQIDQKGDMYFDAQCYPRALAEYTKALAKKPDNAPLLKRIAETILADENPRAKAVDYIERYLVANPDDADAYYLAAQAHYHAHNFSKANKYVNDFLAVNTDKAKTKKAEKLISWISNAQRMMRDTLKYKLVNLGSMINTPNNEINPFIYNDDKSLVFSSDEKFNSAELINYFNIKTSDNIDLAWTKSKTVSGMINTLYDDYVSGVGNNKLYFCSNRDVEFAIYESDINGTRFSDGIKLEAPIDMKGDEIGATLTPSGDTIIFSGTTDNGRICLYYSIKVNDMWGESRPLPGAVNDPNADTNYPVLARQGKRLYFASNREGSMGGYDIYYSDMQKSGEWGTPVQMKYPINDTYDNLTISFSRSERYAYISSIREGGFGGRDIYAIVFDNVMPSTALMKCFAGIKAKPKPQALKERPLIQVMDGEGNIVANVKMNMATSTFVLALDPGTYTLSVDSPEAKPYTSTIEVPEKFYDDNVIEQIIILEPAQ